MTCFYTSVLLLSVLIVSATASCPVTDLPSDIQTIQDPGTQPIAYLSAVGTRLYNCVSGRPTSTSGGAVNVTGGLLGKAANEVEGFVWSGDGFYPGDEFGNGVFSLRSTDNSTGGIVYQAFNLTLDYSTVLYFPSPDSSSALDWARWSVFTTPLYVGENFEIGWGNRVNTTDGGIPTSCDAANSTSGLLTESYTADYYFYPCPSSTSAAPRHHHPGAFVVLLATLGLLACV